MVFIFETSASVYLNEEIGITFRRTMTSLNNVYANKVSEWYKSLNDIDLIEACIAHQ